MEHFTSIGRKAAFSAPRFGLNNASWNRKLGILAAFLWLIGVILLVPATAGFSPSGSVWARTSDVFYIFPTTLERPDPLSSRPEQWHTRLIVTTWAGLIAWLFWLATLVTQRWHRKHFVVTTNISSKARKRIDTVFHTIQGSFTALMTLLAILVIAIESVDFSGTPL
ncbi:hypothetical protein [Actinobaculum suis]|uniref:hypothetical protein n=1 Tax=Actinobaculum suis TaxID=1657 RepID=UPI000A43A64F|nr:hypothetical protein [Actinobaculum suis]